jgi:thiol peroxidase
MIERMGIMQHGGQDVTIVGEDIQVGQLAPDFTSQAFDWSLIQPLDATRGKVRILAPLPSLDTSTCDRETRRFNQEAANLDKDIVIIVISTDLPPTQKRWCGAAGIDQVMVVSDHMNVEFGTKYGCLMKERRWLRRAVFVIDRDGYVTYAAYMPVLGQEPDYDAVLAAARTALAK